MEMVNGYVFLDLTKSNVYSKALKVLGTDKPVVIKDGSGSPYFVDSLTLSGTNVVITKGGKTITIANDNTITNEGLVANPTMENIKDLSGNNRFVEGEGDNPEITDVNHLYSKWSLSGTHLMVVSAIEVENAKVLAANDILNTFVLPDFIKDKISSLQGTTFVSISAFNGVAANYSTQQLSCTLYKTNDGVGIGVLTALTLSAKRTFRIQFDLLIDAE